MTSSPVSEQIHEAFFDKALSERYLAYALSTITSRSLPDIRDGLKPVQRRLLWAMRLLKLDPASAYKKCARVVGDVIGKYHPHGDQSVYDAMVRLAQSFALRYPLVDGQGNFGNIDGDNAAAMRYTEARLTAAAYDLMEGIDDGAVDFRLTYNSEEEEPEFFSGLFPNLLANGSSGIAVGMATSIPPHNVAELIDAITHMIDHPEASTEDLLQFVKGPDFPTGGQIVNSRASIKHSYKTGRGAFRVRARYQIEDIGRGGWILVIQEIPWQVPKSRLIEEIAALINDKKLPILSDIRDESDETIRIVLEPRSRTVDPQLLMDGLFHLTSLETRISLNMNVLNCQHTPCVLALHEVIKEWLGHQFTVLQRRAHYRLQRIDDRIELLEGYLIAYLNLDRIIEIIRNEDEVKPILITEFGLNDRQAEAILNMRLRALKRLEELEIKTERDSLKQEQAALEALLASDTLQRKRLKSDLALLHKRYGLKTKLGARHTLIMEETPAKAIPLDAMIEREAVTVVLSKRGWIRALKGHVDLKSAEALRFKEGDGADFSCHAYTTDRLLIAANNGRFYTLLADRLPGGRGFGEPIRLMLDIANDTQIMGLFPLEKNAKFLVISSDGRGFITNMSDISAETRKGKQIVKLRKDQHLAILRPIDSLHDHIALIGENRKLLVFPLADIPELSKGSGVQLQRYRDGGLSDATTFTFEQGLSWPMGGETGRIRTELNMVPWRVARGASGRLPPVGFPRDNKFAL